MDFKEMARPIYPHNSPYLVYLEHSKGGIGFLVFGILVLVYLWRDINVTLYWLKESILKNWLLGFLPQDGFPGYILCSVIVYLSVILLHAIVNEC